MQLRSDLHATTALALVLWVALVPALSAQTLRSSGFRLPVEVLCEMPQGACSASATSDNTDCVPHTIPVKCCVCLRVCDLAMDVTPPPTPLPAQPDMVLPEPSDPRLASLSIRPPVPPPKIS